MSQFTFSKVYSGSSTIHLLEYDQFEINNYTHYLNESELTRLNSFGNDKRKREYLATRILCQSIFPKSTIHYNEHGAPYIHENEWISISHSKQMIGIAVNTHYKVGLDMEPHRPNILPITKKFLSENEKKVFDVNCPIEMTKVWSAKEALYKLADRKKIIFATELLLDKDENQNWLGTIINPDHSLEVKLDIFDRHNTIISINSQEIEKRPKQS